MNCIRAIILGAVSIILPLFSFGQSPLIIVNDVITDLTDLKQIAPQDIEHIDTEPADEQTIEKYGPRANNGVVRVTLRYDEAAKFIGSDRTFDRYIAENVVWASHEPAARVAVRYTVNTDGRITLGEILEATDKRFKRRVIKAMESAAADPLWIPAKRKGEPVVTEHVLQVQLPEGKPMPREPYIIIL